jgi:hypothetical protein
MLVGSGLGLLTQNLERAGQNSETMLTGGIVPKPKKRPKVARARARETQSAQSAAEKKKMTPEQYTRRRIFGWTLVVFAVLLGVTHWLAHLGVLYQDRPLWDLTIGYPMAGLLGIGGAIVLSK